MFDKQIVVDRIEALADHTVAVRYVVTVTEDGKPFAEQIKGNYINPGDDYSQEDAKVQAVCMAVHTPEVLAAYQTAKEEAKLRMPNVNTTTEI